MTTTRLLLTTVSLAILAVVPLHAAVHITALDKQVQETEAGQRVIQPVVLANENAHYTLTYDVIRDPETPDEVTSNWWQWTQGYVTIGMTEPSRPNWYWQGFLRWTFDDESLHVRPAQFRVVRQSGQDGMVEYLWDTPKVRARLRFALATGSDKLLMFADWEPKGQIQQTRMQLSCYPATFAEPRNRRVTTALGTREPGETIDLDLQQERWVLYEDVTEGRPAQGSAGLLIGTPEAFSAVQIPVADYGIVTTLEMAPQARSFALGLYDFPTLPDYQRTREYFGRSADAEARQIEEMAAGDLDQPLPPMPMDEQRLAQLLAEGADMLDRPAELWRPDPDPLDFPWAAEIPGEPIRTAIFSRRWTAWETMELARRLEMDAEHLYFDANDRLVNPRAWPYAAHTGIGALPQGVAARRAAELASDETMDLFLCGGIHGTGIPGVARTAIMQQVANGAGLLICGHDATSGWEEELFADLDAEMTESVLDGFSWELIPGYRDIDRGRVEGEPPVRVYRHGEGRVVHLNVNLNTYSSLVPRNDASEGLQAATDRCLAIAARCALAAAGREMTDSREDGDSLLIRVQDDLGRVLHLDEQADTRMLDLPVLPTGRTYYTDILVRNAAGETIGMASRVQGPVLEAERARIIGLSISPATVTHEPAVPMVEMPDGGTVECTARLQNLGDDAWLRWEVRDAFDRLVAREMTRVSPGEEAASASLDLPPPVTVCHRLDVALTREDEELSYARQRFTMSMDYPYDDFTALMWTYAGGDPFLRRTDRMCYEWGADMCDLCHMGGYSDAGAAREYEVSARSGLRLVPYVTRIAGSANEEYERVPCLHSPDYITAEREKLTTTCRQAAPYSPAAYTLGDENYLFRGDFECCHTEWSVATFQQWLQGKYGTIAALNAAWASDYADFTEIQRPMILSEAAEQTESFAPWIDHKLFMDTAFADAHERAAGFVRAQDPGAKVGWDGLLGYNWRAGYDFDKLTRTLELNETYTMQWLEGELVRSFKRDDALTGKWGNAIADNEEGWHAFPWDCLLAGDNSVWWWTSWGCDYIPFNPDLSQSTFGQWFFEAVRETASGPGKLLLNAGRQHSPIAVLYSHRDLFAATIMGQMVQDQPWAGDGHFLDQHE
ncbi:MAG: beta-galactosidase, partial [Armatimonadota bacterium]